MLLLLSLLIVAVVAVVVVAAAAAVVVVAVVVRVPAKLGNQNGKNGHLQQQTTANYGEFPF